jgi:hypothetical protein
MKWYQRILNEQTHSNKIKEVDRLYIDCNIFLERSIGNTTPSVLQRLQNNIMVEIEKIFLQEKPKKSMVFCFVKN